MIEDIVVEASVAEAEATSKVEATSSKGRPHP